MMAVKLEFEGEKEWVPNLLERVPISIATLLYIENFCLLRRPRRTRREPNSPLGPPWILPHPSVWLKGKRAVPVTNF